MKLKQLLLTILLLIGMAGCKNQDKHHDNIGDPPSWAADAIWYQIFVERFHNGDTLNDPKPEHIRTASDFYAVPEDWHISPWTKNWYDEDDYAKDLEGDFYARLQLRRYGGDLQGVFDRLDYLSDLGVTAIYFNPLNDAPSLHKYDVRNYHHIDINFGPDPEGDLEIMAKEDPNDPNTWQWTSADRMFLELVAAMHERGMRVILDVSWNHTGVEFWAWKDIIKNGSSSAYKDWYEIIALDDPETPENELDYKGWLNIKSLPELKKVGTTQSHRPGFPYEGDLHPSVKAHIFAVSQRWLAPDGDVTKGIDGFRLDVADHVPMGFWRDYRKFVKGINPEAYLVGEIWWEEWPDKLMNPVPYVGGDVFDGIMFYQIYRPARSFFAKTDLEIDAQQFVDSLQYQWKRIKWETQKAMMNTATTHDSPRLLSSFYNKGKYKYMAKLNDDPAYKAGKPDMETYSRLRLYLMHQFSIPGAPHIWNGDEMGMWGADDPDCRKPLWWPEFEFENENRSNLTDLDDAVDQVGFNHELHAWYRQLIGVRKQNPVLASGEISFIHAEGKQLAYRRFDHQTEILVYLNAGTEAWTTILPKDQLYLNLLSGEEIKGEVTMNALDGLMLKLIR